jgi:hypothetical protein
VNHAGVAPVELPEGIGVGLCRLDELGVRRHRSRGVMPHGRETFRRLRTR